MTIRTIGDFDGDMNARLRARAARHGRSMEEEARSILYRTHDDGFRPGTGAGLVADIRVLVEHLDGIELAQPSRTAMPEPHDFSAHEFAE